MRLGGDTHVLRNPAFGALPSQITAQDDCDNHLNSCIFSSAGLLSVQQADETDFSIQVGKL